MNIEASVKDGILTLKDGDQAITVPVDDVPQLMQALRELNEPITKHLTRNAKTGF